MTRPPLDGVTVLEVGVFLAAPFATTQLADLGARVVKVENPAAPEPVRLTGPFVDGASAAFAQINRNKESVALDLKSAPGPDAFLRLAGWADVVVENRRWTCSSVDGSSPVRRPLPPAWWSRSKTPASAHSRIRRQQATPEP
jgi:crotonobetainyl-CoA:carnitine CoA-transferase CaiB-like acyl-CoA transferase